MITITPVYLALLGFLYILLTMRVVRRRVSQKTAIGDADDAILKRRIRAHGNFAEYVPIQVLLLLCAELQGTPAWVLHLFGLAIIISRAAHAWSISQVSEPIVIRQYAMITTLAIIAFLALGNLGHAIF